MMRGRRGKAPGAGEADGVCGCRERATFSSLALPLRILAADLTDYVKNHLSVHLAASFFTSYNNY